MKFGHNLARNQVPEWSSYYIDYKSLKRLVKVASSSAAQTGEVDLAAFFYSLDRNLETVDGFYNRKYSETARRLRLLHDRYGSYPSIPDGIDKDEMEDLMGALLELRSQLRLLQWYGEVNRRGFTKITKKLDKKVPKSPMQRQYLASKVDPRPFATNAKLQQDMRAVNDWMSKLGDAKLFDDAASVNSTSSFRTVSSRVVLNFSQSLLDVIDQAVRADDSAVLGKSLEESSIADDSSTSNLAFQQFLLNLLQRSITCRAPKCIDFLLGRVRCLEEDDDIYKRNCIHRLVIAISRAKSPEGSQAEDKPRAQQFPNDGFNFITPAEPPIYVPPRCYHPEQEAKSSLGRSGESVLFLEELLKKIELGHKSALQARDSYGRLPLHYAAQYGCVIVCQIIIKHMQDWGQFDVSKGIDSEEWQDHDGHAPLHLAVMGGHRLTTKTLLEAENWQGDVSERIATRTTNPKSGAVLALATKSNFVSIVKLLIDAGVDVNYKDEQGETALHVAARLGFQECAEALIEGVPGRRADLDICEKTFGWTPLFIACVDGHLQIAELLIRAGADIERSDVSGWTAQEHASLRGHLEIARHLASFSSPPKSPSSTAVEGTLTGSPPTGPSPLDERRSSVISKDNAQNRTSEAPKTFGHRYLTDESLILVSLGTMDPRKAPEAVKLDDIPLADAHATQLDTALSIVVSASGASGSPTVIDLPVQENVSTDPTSFTTTDPSKVRILFDIVPTYAGSHDKIIGRAVALLSSIKPSVGSQRISLQGDVKVPIMAAKTMDVIGHVLFNFLVIKPFSHPNISITENHTYWKKMASTTIIGHRGLGKNMAARKSLQLGENTIQSFIAAANLGASYVEFDVQLTKDHVPVIYHDFLVSETGIDAPVHTLTLEQFLHVSEHQTPRSSRPASPDDVRIVNGDSRSRPGQRQRSYSVDISEGMRYDMSERMKHTRDFKMKGFKGNSRGNFIQAPFTTLEEMFKTLPESIGFNIEMKYPMLFESEAQEMDTYAVELNSFVDTVLTKVYDLGSQRNIIFSSFNPDICLLLSFKQPSIPILFLTDAGTSPAGDIRASSLQEAIRFASRWNLLGVVTAAEPLVLCPRLVKVVKESGLVCVSYGTLNNDPNSVKRQVKEGIDAVIVDSVLAIRKGLTDGENRKPEIDMSPKGEAAFSPLTPATPVPLHPNGLNGISIETVDEATRVSEVEPPERENMCVKSTTSPPLIFADASC